MSQAFIQVVDKQKKTHLINVAHIIEIIPIGNDTEFFLSNGESFWTAQSGQDVMHMIAKSEDSKRWIKPGPALPLA